jgi:7-carboxy-7-deazaguanine synthase
MGKKVTLIENFRSFQGEGPDMGRAALILRFKTCNLSCKWCDTAVKMRISAEAPYDLDDIQKTINETKAGVLLTGGEPTVNRHFNEAVSILNDLNYPFANVESNGFHLKELIKSVDELKPVKFIYSPKIFSQKDTEEAIERTKELLPLKRLFIKIVYENEDYMNRYCKFLSKEVDDISQSERVFLMPEGVTRSDLLRNAPVVFDAAEKYKFNFSSRLHIMYSFV